MFRFMQSLDWKYVVTETAIVAIAVAMALSADAWWDERTDRAAESAYLQGLQEEFSATALDLEQEIASSMKSTAAIDDFMMRNLIVSDVFQADQMPKAPFAADVSGLLADRDLWNILVVRRIWIGNRRMSLDHLQRTLKQIEIQLAVAE